MYLWTNEEIEKILIQLEEQDFPFKKYSFTKENGRLKLLGRGGFALVYEAESGNGGRHQYAIKVIGFGEKHVESAFFEKSVVAQKELGLFQQNVVKICDYAERFLWIDEGNHVIRVQKSEEETGEANCLKLQFILMEKLQPVLQRDQSGRASLVPERLAQGDEKEILKFAYEIGKALSLAHRQNILHRDVKLENIFYTEKGKHYKLGDFGIAKVTDDGMASTVAFTKGYGAPEVIGSLEERYDNTADIYSFGILLYVILNGLKFPDSDNYHVNSKKQYQQGYVLPRPAQGSDGLWQVVEKMCRYNPDERYQSMDEALDALEELIFHTGTHYPREHKAVFSVIGILMFFLGTFAWKLTFRPEMVVQLSKTAYIFLALAIGKWILKLLKKNVMPVSVIILGLGMYLTVSSGFSWVKLLLVVCVTFSSGNFSGLFAGAVLTVRMVSLVAGENQQILKNGQDYRWVAVTFLSLAVVMLLRYIVLREREAALMLIYVKKGRYWALVFMLYASMLLYGISTNGKTADMCSGFLGERLTGELMTYDLGKVGAIGMGISAAWMIREKILSGIEKRKSQNVKPPVRGV